MENKDETTQSVLEYAGSAPSAPTPLAQLAGLLLKILAIYFIVEAIPNLEGMFFWTDPGRKFSLELVYPLCIALGYLLPAGILLWKAKKIGPRLVNSGAGGVSGSQLNTLDLQSVAFSVLGVYLMVRATPDLVSSLYWMLRDARWQAYGPVERLRIFIGPACELAFGVLLFFRARGIAAIWHRARRAGMVHPEEQTKSS